MNIPKIKISIVATSRDCFPIEISRTRKEEVLKSCRKIGCEILDCETIVENEKDVKAALDEVKSLGADALVIYLGNFGPEGPETLLAQRFPGPVMFVAAAESFADSLYNDRGDAYCGMLNASYNMGLRNITPHIPEYPVGSPSEVAEMIQEFIPVARIIIGMSSLKIFGFGPRPQDFLACNAPIKPLYDLGIEVMENSELDLLQEFKAHENDDRIPDIVKDMKLELNEENQHMGILPKLAQYEVTLLDWFDQNLGASDHAVFANKCWPAFEDSFGFVPCYVNSRLASRGIPVACEVDIYGALSEYIAMCASEMPVTILDINNTVPSDMYQDNISITGNYKLNDLFMGFHCGNTPKCLMNDASLKYQKIMYEFIEKGKDPDKTRGTLEGTIKPGDITLFRFQSTAEGALRCYMAQGEVLDMDPKSFGSIGVFAVNEMARFYRHVLISKRYPHHTAVAFKHTGKTLFYAMKMLGITDISYNQPATLPYESENPY